MLGVWAPPTTAGTNPRRPPRARGGAFHPQELDRPSALLTTESHRTSDQKISRSVPLASMTIAPAIIADYHVLPSG